LPSLRICLVQILIQFFAGHDPVPVVCPGCGGVIRWCCCGAVAGVHRSSCRSPLRPCCITVHPIFSR
jgi:hypothetical protein